MPGLSRSAVRSSDEPGPGRSGHRISSSETNDPPWAAIHSACSIRSLFGSGEIVHLCTSSARSVMLAVNSSRRSDRGRSPSSAPVGGVLTLITRVGSRWRATRTYDSRRYRYPSLFRGTGTGRLERIAAVLGLERGSTVESTPSHLSLLVGATVKRYTRCRMQAGSSVASQGAVAHSSSIQPKRRSQNVSSGGFLLCPWVFLSRIWRSRTSRASLSA